MRIDPVQRRPHGLHPFAERRQRRPFRTALQARKHLPPPLHHEGEEEEPPAGVDEREAHGRVIEAMVALSGGNKPPQNGLCRTIGIIVRHEERTVHHRIAYIGDKVVFSLCQRRHGL